MNNPIHRCPVCFGAGVLTNQYGISGQCLCCDGVGFIENERVKYNLVGLSVLPNVHILRT